DAIRIYKPRPEVYALATGHFKIAPGEVVFVSSNRWDVMGAAAFGFRTAWVNRAKMPEEYEPAPSATLADLNGLMTMARWDAPALTSVWRDRYYRTQPPKTFVRLKI